MYVSLSEAKEIALLMRDRLSVDYTNYSIPFFRRRLAYACERLNVRKPQQLIELLQQEDFRQQLLFNMTVPVSEMFRDPGFWRALRQIILQRQWTCHIKVWFPDSGSGEELYSFLIMVYQMGLIDAVNIHVNHPSAIVIEDTRKGLLPLKSIKVNLSNFERIESKDDFESFFDVVEKNYCLKAQLLKNVTFSNHSFSESSSNEQYDLIFFRNSGLIFNRVYQDYCCDYLINHLNARGLLAIGIQENLSELAMQRLTCINDGEKIFEKQII